MLIQFNNVLKHVSKLVNHVKNIKILAMLKHVNKLQFSKHANSC